MGPISENSACISRMLLVRRLNGKQSRGHVYARAFCVCVRVFGGFDSLAGAGVKWKTGQWRQRPRCAQNADDSRTATARVLFHFDGSCISGVFCRTVGHPFPNCGRTHTRNALAADHICACQPPPSPSHPHPFTCVGVMLRNGSEHKDAYTHQQHSVQRSTCALTRVCGQHITIVFAGHNGTDRQLLNVRT